MAEYRFQCRVVDEAGETVISDHTCMTRIDAFGGCESVDMAVGAMLRAFERTARAQYEGALGECK